MITTIVFDIGGVFLHQPEEVSEAVWNGLGMADPGVTDELLFGDDLWTVYKRGGMSEEAYWSEVKASISDRYDGTWENLRDAFETCVVLDEGLASAARLLGRSYQVHALSNAGAELERRLDALGIRDIFGEVINSHRVKLAKPDREIYHLTCDLVGANPNEILFVDDKYRNTSVAEALGFHTHVYTDVETFMQYLSELKLLRGVVRG